MAQLRKSYGNKANNALRSWVEFSRAFMHIRSAENSFVESKGLTIHQFGVLEALYHLGALSVGELTRLILSTPGNMTVVIKNLQEKELIRSIKDKEDRRKTILTISDSGEKLISDIFPEHAENLATYFSCLTAEEQTMLRKLTKKLSKADSSEDIK